MKTIKYTLSALIIVAIALFTACDGGGGGDDPQPSEEDLMKEKLSKTWNISSVTLSNEDVTADFSGFTLTLQSSGSYSTNSSSVERSPNPWPNSGSVEFGGSADSPNLNQLVRDDGLTMSVSTDGSSLSLSFTFSDEHTDSTGGRVEIVNGSWVFQFTAQ